MTTETPLERSGSSRPAGETGHAAAGEFQFLVDRARELGAGAAQVFPAERVVVDERVRLKCAVPVCQGYGNYLHCPPNTLSVEEFRGILARFRQALLVQVVSQRSSVDLDAGGLAGKDAAELEEELHGEPNRLLGRIITGLEAAAFKAGYPYAAAFSGGLCLLCPRCVGVASGEPCRHPFEARPSMEAVGIDVLRTAANAGLPISLSSDQPVRWTGLLLID
jgi:predicted metal-binding protein